MKRAINLFKTKKDYDKSFNTLPIISLSYIEEIGKCKCIVKKDFSQYVTFRAEEANSTIGLASLSSNQTLEYSTDATTWNNMDTSTTIMLSNIDDEVYIRGILSADNTTSDYTQFKMTGKIAASGNCNAIWNYQDLNAPLKVHCGYYMFLDCTSLTIAPDLPTVEVVPSGCYHGMFQGCSSLTVAPELPAMEVCGSSYKFMFTGCSSLTVAPELPATKIENQCYNNMFDSCKSLTTAPSVLPATTLFDSCYESMFSSCTSLTTAPDLPATTLSEKCYQGMFSSCTSLTTAPDLPATDLDDCCYLGMFNGCKSLTTTPSVLPATELAESCYSSMFRDCTSLTTTPELPATMLTESCYWGMFNGCTNLNHIKCLATDISATNCTTDWVYRVASTGTFIKHIDMNDWLVDSVNGIPSGWTVFNNDGTTPTPNPEDPGNSDSDDQGNSDVDLTTAYVTFKAEEDNSSIGLEKLSTNQTLEYSTDASTWNTFDTTTNISLNNGDEVYVRGILIANNTYSNYTQFKMSGKIAAYGNCNAIWDYQDLDAPLKEYCGYSMFYGCTSLTTSPELLATTLGERCYESMFEGCINLTTAPELPATVLARFCYECMFRDCTSLTTAPELPATTLTVQCYENMFCNCTSLTTAPELPATTLSMSCYQNMFNGCTSLTAAPELPATTLDKSCYCGMFFGCTSLTAAPELPATMLTESCYWGMFNCCENLNHIKCLATDISATNCTTDWVYRVSSTGTFIKHIDMNDWLVDSVNGIPSGWTVFNNDGTTPTPDPEEPGNSDSDDQGNSDIDLTTPYVTFRAEEANSTIGLNSLSSDQTLEYSTDATTWTNMDTSTIVTLSNIDDKVYVRGVLSGNNTENVRTQFKMTGKIAASGNCNALWNYQDLDNPLKEFCGALMFADCTSLTTAPELPATMLVDGCYYYMFYGCSSLTTAPELPATMLAENCYAGMFRDCSSLVTAPELPSTDLVKQCYSYMFHGCSSLTTAPELPATDLQVHNYYYANMFEDCSSLNYIKCLALNPSGTSDWVKNVSPTGTFVKAAGVTWQIGVHGIPTGWTVIEDGTTPTPDPEEPGNSDSNDLGNSDIDLTTAYVTFAAEEDGSSIGLEKISTNQTLEYSTDTTTWNTFDTTTNISLNNGDEVYVRGVLSKGVFIKNEDADGFSYPSEEVTEFKMTGKIKASGNCNAIWNYQDLNAPLKIGCGLRLFADCTSLTTAPELPDTTLAEYCYDSMFCGCTNLTTAPELPATTLVKRCYECMFSGCTALTQAPELPATTLASNCYKYMFSDCTGLTQAPVLPATTLTPYCYDNMFKGCSILNYIKCLATDISATDCTFNWVNGVASTGTFIKHPNTTSWPTGNLGSHGIPKGWTVINDGETPNPEV